MANGKNEGGAVQCSTAFLDNKFNLINLFMCLTAEKQSQLQPSTSNNSTVTIINCKKLHVNSRNKIRSQMKPSEYGQKRKI